MTPRMAAVLSLNACLKNNKFANIELDAAIRKYGFEGLDKSFYTRLLYGTMERKITLDHVISTFSAVKQEKIDPLVFCILRTGIYQLLYMDKVPDSAAVNQAVELCKTLCPGSYAGYVNAIMRNILRQRDTIPELLREKGGLTSVSLTYSIPLWMISLWAEDYGEDRAKSIARHFCERDPFVTLRVNTLKCSPEELKDKLGKIARYGGYTKNVLKLDGTYPAEELYGYAQGLFFVQDEASCLVSELVGKNGANGGCPLIIDVCACPGGKSFGAALEHHDSAVVRAYDLHENRLRLIERGAARLGIRGITTAPRDARTPDRAYFGKADAVLCDVPCSGLGVIAKKPDIRYKTYDDIARLPEVQREILKASANYVKPGGMIVYSTCTLRKAENEEVVEWFLKENDGYQLSPTGLFAESDDGMVTFFPDERDTDGFFAAKIVRKPAETKAGENI